MVLTVGLSNDFSVALRIVDLRHDSGSNISHLHTCVSIGGVALLLTARD